MKNIDTGSSHEHPLIKEINEEKEKRKLRFEKNGLVCNKKMGLGK